MSGTGNTTIPTEPESRSSLASSEGLVLALFLAWSAHQPERVGEAALFDPRAPGPSVAGREVPGGPARVHFLQILPGETIDGGPLTGENISQEQLEIDVVGEALRIRNVGRALVRVNGTDLPRWQAVIAPPGTAVEVHGNCVLLVGVSPLSLPAPHPRLLPLHAFGQADRMGFAGESWRMHRLRGDVVIAAMAARHVLVTGETGTGKELVAKGIHALSLRSREPFMTTNSSSFTQELAAYELFGNAKNVPNVGTPAREGYFGHARGGTLFLDEMGIVLDVVQAPLLRALEGSYNRVGDPVARPTECIVIVATNLGPDSIKHDVLYRLGVRVETPALRERREDIALLVQMFLLRYADGNAAFEKALVKSDGTGRRTVAVDPSLVVNLLRSPLRGNVRELANIVELAAASAGGQPAVRWPSRLTAPPPEPLALAPAAVPSDPAAHAPEPAPPAFGNEEASPGADELCEGLGKAPPPDREYVRRMLDTFEWHFGKTAAALGMSEDQFYRLRAKYGLIRRD